MTLVRPLAAAAAVLVVLARRCSGNADALARLLASVPSSVKRQNRVI